MTAITIFGTGNMGTVIGQNFEDAGNQVNFINSNSEVDQIGDIVVFAVPYGAVEGIISKNKDKFAGKIIIDITNPVDFETFDGLVVDADSSAAQVIATALPEAAVVKGFNTNFGGTLAAKKVADSHQTTVLLASDDAEAKETVTKALEGSGLAVIDAGALKRARELEAIGFLQISLAAAEKISWTGGFGVFK